jgi:hypothetical protein
MSKQLNNLGKTKQIVFTLKIWHRIWFACTFISNNLPYVFMCKLLSELLCMRMFTFILLRIYESSPAALKTFFVPSLWGVLCIIINSLFVYMNFTAMTGYDAWIFVNEMFPLSLLLLLRWLWFFMNNNNVTWWCHVLVHRANMWKPYAGCSSLSVGE